MGWGDEIMATADVRAMQQKDPRKVAVLGKNGLARWHPIWDQNERIATPDEVALGVPVQWLNNYAGHRPYLDYARSDRNRFYFTDYRAQPGEIVLTREELAWGAARVDPGSILLEPNLKNGATPNKNWGSANWAALAQLLADDFPLIQIGPMRGYRQLKRARFVETPTVRAAASVVAAVRAAVLPEGGLHHAAAALGVRAVVLFGGYISPDTTGYAAHTNLFTGGVACGMRVRCEHCRDAMRAITAQQVARALRAICGAK
jgi:hypothetical protein